MALQEVLALAVVVLVVGLVLWRRRSRRRSGGDGCSGCEAGSAKQPGEHPLRFRRR